MKTTTILSILFFSFLTIGFTMKSGIEKCYLNFENHSDLKVSSVDRLPKSSEKFRELPTENGNVEISRIDGYRILYNNEKKAPFVNLKVELSHKKHFETDRKGLTDHLRFINQNSHGMESTDLLRYDMNGYEIVGFNRASLEQGNTLGTFVMFPENGVTVFFYFNNLNPEFRDYKTFEEYKEERHKFFDEYTAHLKNCLEN